MGKEKENHFGRSTCPSSKIESAGSGRELS